jgi:hypothetical protein
MPALFDCALHSVSTPPAMPPLLLLLSPLSLLAAALAGMLVVAPDHLRLHLARAAAVRGLATPARGDDTAYLYNQQQLRLELCPTANINNITVTP